MLPLVATQKLAKFLPPAGQRPLDGILAMTTLPGRSLGEDCKYMGTLPRSPSSVLI